MMNANFFILHLSDIHFGKFYGFADKDAIEREVARAIRVANSSEIVLAETKGEVIHPKFLFCTGDLTSAGDEKFFPDAKNFLQQTASQLKINTTNIMCCPGNHDFRQDITLDYRNAFGRDNHSVLENWGAEHFRGYVETASSLQSQQHDDSYIRRLPKYNEINSPSDIYSIQYFEEYDLLVYSLNSVVMHTLDRQTQYGYVGEKQLRNVDRSIQEYCGRFSKHIINPSCKIVLMHHPARSATNFDHTAMRDPLYFNNWVKRRDVNLVLNGHRHYAGIDIIGDELHKIVFIGAGSVGGDDKQRADNHVSINLIRVRYKSHGSKQVSLITGEFVKIRDDWEYRHENIKYARNEVRDRTLFDYAKSVGLDFPLENTDNTRRSIAEGAVVHLEGSQVALKSYIAACKLATILRATSFLHSHFWSGLLSDDIMKANRDLLMRNCTIKRIFLINKNIKQYVKNRVQIAFMRLMNGDDSEWYRIARTNQNLKDLSENFRLDMRICGTSSYNSMQKNIYDPEFQELALYESKETGFYRCDVFNISEEGQIQSADLRAGTSLDRSDYDQLCTEFERAWSKSLAIQDFTLLTDQEIKNVESGINFTQNFLLKFEILDKIQDPTLVDEASIVVDFLRSRLSRKYGVFVKKFNTHLEVGVCTGRYPELLKNLMNTTIATDVNNDVQDYLHIKFPKLKFVLGDIRDKNHVVAIEKINNGKKFDVITCLLGTPCHFGLGFKYGVGGNVSGFVQGMRNMISLLAPGGMLVFSIWKSDPDNKLIEIFHEFERKRLLANTPNEVQLQSVMENLGSTMTLELLRTTQRLSVYCITKKPSI